MHTQHNSCLLIINVFYASESFQEKKTVTVFQCDTDVVSLWEVMQILSEETILFHPLGPFTLSLWIWRIRVIMSSSRVRICFTFLDIHVDFFENIMQPKVLCFRLFSLCNSQPVGFPWQNPMDRGRVEGYSPEGCKE